MYHFDKHFTVAEANGLIPRIREIFFQINALIDETRKPSQLFSTKVETLSEGRTNGKQKKPLSEEEVRRQINEMLFELADQGIVIQDMNRGLVDFPALIYGEEVLLCYEMSDGDTLKYYHDLNGGYAGRKPIPPELY